MMKALKCPESCRNEKWVVFVFWVSGSLKSGDKKGVSTMKVSVQSQNIQVVIGSHGVLFGVEEKLLWIS